MRVSNKCIEMVKEFEGCYLEAYQDEVGVWTIGFGITSSDKAITGKAIKKGMKISQATAEKWLVESLTRIYLPKVMKYQDRYHFNSSQIDALVSFAYNIGNIDQLTGYGTRSIALIESRMLLYNKAGGKTLNGLSRRRQAELKMFQGGKKLYDGAWPKLPSRGYFQLDDKGKEVEKLQMLLCWFDLLENDQIDGVYGPKTEKAVKELQKIVKTTRNGKFGNKCLPWCKKYKK